MKIKTQTGKILDLNEFFSFPEVLENYPQLEGYISKLREVCKVFLITTPISVNAFPRVREKSNMPRRKFTRDQKIEMIQDFNSTKGKSNRVLRDEIIKKWNFESNELLNKTVSNYRRVLLEKQNETN